MSAEFELADSDLVIIRLTLRGRDGGASVTVDESPTVADLGLSRPEAGAAPVFDNDEFTLLLGEDPEGALRMQASFIEATAEFMAQGGTPPAESLAQAVVDWVVETRPDGHNYVTSDSADGYVISPKEINIHGPIDLGDGERGFRVTAVGTWG